MYHPFNLFITRTPFSPFGSLEEELFNTKILDLQIQEAIYIASPVLYTELQKYITGMITTREEKLRIELALYRYISRMSSRCTPFGLFAGYSIGHIIEEKTDILLGNFNRHTRLDMYFLYTLAQELSKRPDIKEKIKYYPNTTLYTIGKKYRYIEYQYINSKRIHRIASVTRSAYLDTILKMAKEGIKISELLIYLINETGEQENILEFIEELIDSQIIISELNPSVTGDSFFMRIIRILEELNIHGSLVSSLKEIQDQLRLLDLSQRGNIELYQSIIQNINEINIPYEEKYLFQVDMVKNAVKATLGKDIINELQSAMIFLNKITYKNKDETLSQFQQTFYNRYEDREVSLMEALDPEIGIGYPANKNFKNDSPFLENFSLPNRTEQMTNFQPDPFLSILFKKTMEVSRQNKNEIIFNDEDVKNFNTYWDDLPPTTFSMFEIIKSDSDNSIIRLHGFYGSSGAKLLTRFAHMDENIISFVNEITAKEQELMPPNVLLAEIAHLPDSRVGNVLSRPHIRDYEILYLANSDLPEKRLIYTSDLFLSIRQGRIYLRSKKLNKEIIPRLTNAHNYKNNSMPVYQFLCDMQIQQRRGNLYFNWGYLNNELSFFPRVRYKNTILSPAIWKVKTTKMKHLFMIKEDNKLLTETKKWQKEYPLPQKVLLSDGDHELLVDWENVRNIRALFSIINNREIIVLTEFLYEPKNSVVRDENGNSYSNECIVAFHKNNKE